MILIFTLLDNHCHYDHGYDEYFHQCQCRCHLHGKKILITKIEKKYAVLYFLCWHMSIRYKQDEYQHNYVNIQDNYVNLILLHVNIIMMHVKIIIYNAIQYIYIACWNADIILLHVAGRNMPP